MEAKARTDVKSTIIGGKRLSCICSTQSLDTKTIEYSEARGIVVERVECGLCDKQWTRINAR